ncbi:fatty-acyl-CoA synthase [Jatrophihabitans sp. GAS493]|uniref:AMP-binding protein n=1 Tax=Jatrophihabitans sp. GAS493 TaxID=1907575 RepID=UPI000BB93AEA|nr:AMP-binding protein [Jatrophihabitans sp. GAS493]SOD70763.1 fatty-acyl-CoA synthase [Jatrophihabitans sp. GAS493]
MTDIGVGQLNATEQPMIARRNNWPNQIARHAHQNPDGVALRFLGADITWRRLHERVERTADVLARNGVMPGSRVAILMLNRPEFLEIVFAAHTLGAMAVPVNFRLTATEIEFILSDCEPAVLAVDSSLASVAIAATANLAAPPATLIVGDVPSGVHLPSLDEEIAANPPPHPLVDVPDDSPSLLLYTSGTTGRPKGAVLTHLNMQMQTITLVRSLGLIHDDDLNICAAPLFHIAGIGLFGPSLLAGAPTVLMPSGNFDPVVLVDALESEGVTSVFLVPTQWQAVCALPDITSRKLRIRTMSWGAAPATTALLQRMAEVFPDAENVALFGQTEMSPVTCVLDGADAIRKIGSVGKPISTLSIRVVDDEMNDVPTGEVGEIVYRGPTLMAGYWRNPVATAESFHGGWFHSGDLVRRDEEGFVYVVDRKKDMLISGGENIYCAEVEDIIASHPLVDDVAIIGRPDQRWGEVPIAIVVATGAMTTADLDLWCGGKLARYKRPRDVVLVDQLPRNASGKVLKGELRAKHSVSS